MRRLSFKEVQDELLDILSEFDRVCRENNIRYTLAYGTLIGAVRHKGFIPWDDDVDVCVPRPDYERLVQLAKEGVFKKNFVLTGDRNKGDYHAFAKLVNTDVPIKTGNHIEVPYLFLDVFPLDGMPESKEEIDKMFRKENRWSVIKGITEWYTMYKWWGPIAWIIGWWFYLGVMVFGGHYRMLRKLNKSALRYPFGESELCGVHGVGYKRGIFPTKYMDELCELEVEGRKFLAMSNWDDWLTRRYGDYMQLPPKNQRVSHHYFRAYRAEEGEVVKKKKIKFPF